MPSTIDLYSAAVSTEPQDPGPLPLEELDIVPQWIKAPAKSYAGHPGEQRERERPRGRRVDERDRDRGRDHPPRRPQGPRREQGTKPPPRDRGERPRPGGPRIQRKPTAPPASPVDVVFVPEEKGLVAMIETMKQSGFAYAFFDIAKLVLNKPERHLVKVRRKPGADGKPGSLFVVTIDENVFLSQDEAVRYVFRRHADKVFKERKTPVDPPKGNFSFVSRCGITGAWLGPANYHEYQARLVRHHQQKLRHIPFEKFKAQIQAVRDPDAVKAWVESMSFKYEYECLLDSEPKAFSSRDELEKHFYENHLAQFVASAPEVTISGPASRQLDNHAITTAVREAWEAERRFPLKTANEFRGRLVHEGFHFFKHGKGITYFSRIKPNRFESTAHLSEQVQQIVAFVRGKDGCTRKQLLEQFAGVDEARLLADLHWLIQDGYVIEFFNGKLWVLADKPPKPAPAPIDPASAPPLEAPAETPIPPTSQATASPADAATTDPAAPADPGAAADSSAEAS